MSKLKFDKTNRFQLREKNKEVTLEHKRYNYKDRNRHLKAIQNKILIERCLLKMILTCRGEV